MVYKPTFKLGGPILYPISKSWKSIFQRHFWKGVPVRFQGPWLNWNVSSCFLFCSRPLVQVPAKTIWCMNWGCELQLRSQEYRLLTCNQKSKIWIYLNYCPYFLQRWSQVKKKNGRGQNQDEEQLEEVARAWGATHGCTDSRYSFRTRGLVALCIPR